MASVAEPQLAEIDGRPRISPRRMVRRERLISRLLTEADVPTVLIVAPAGYGKTTILSQWDEADARPFVWLTLDEGHNDPAHLLGTLVSGLDAIEPVDERVFAAIGVPRPSISSVVVPRLCRSLRDRDRPLVIVLDDVQRLDNPEALEALVLLATCMPAGSQLALASRDEPSIPLGRLRGHGFVAELRAHDLVMARSEARALFEGAGLSLDDDAVEKLVGRTEGWPVALYLAALSMSTEDEVQETLERFHGDDRFVADYLRDELLSRLTRRELDFLTRTSILERLNGPLCDAVLEQEGSGRVLRRFARANLLLVPLDHRDEEYRYHGLLREMLESEFQQMAAGQQSALHARAAHWHAEHGDVDDAVRHAIASGDTEAAGALIWAKAAEYESRGRTGTLRRWLEAFSEEQISGSPPLALTRAMTRLSDGNGGQVERWTSIGLRELDHGSWADREELETAATVMRATAAAYDGVVRMREDVSSASGLLPADSAWRSLCRLIEGAAYHLRGDRRRAREALEEGARRGAAAAPSVETVCLAQLALVALDDGDVDEADALVSRALAEVDVYGTFEYPTQALVFAASGLVRGRRGLVDTATRDVKSSTRLLSQLTDFSPWYECETRITLARALLTLDDVAGARSHLSDAARYLRQTPDATVLREWIERTWEEVDAASAVTGRWPLTPAELRLLHYLPTHLSFREIAEQVFVSTNTVKSQARAIYRKLGVSSRAEAVACAQAVGLLESSGGVLPPGLG